MWKPIFCPREDCSQSGICLLAFPKCISTWGSTRGGSVGILMFYTVSAVLHLGNSITSGDLGVECIHPSFDISGNLCLSSCCISSSHSVQVSGRTCHRSIQTFGSSSVMLDGCSLAFHNSQHVGRNSSALSCHKRSHCECFGRPFAQGSVISTYNP